MKKTALSILFFIFLISHLDISADPFALESKHTIDTTWPTGFQATVILTNNSNRPTSNWSATFTLPQGQSINNLWNGVYTANGQTITVKNPSWARGENIPPSSSTTFGMIVSETSNNSPSLNILEAIANSTIPPMTNETEQNIDSTEINQDSLQPSAINDPIVKQLEPISIGSIEHAAWYIDWTSWDYPVPEALNTVHIFVGNMHTDRNGNPVIDGFGNFTSDKMKTFVQKCHEKGIAVKISLGGGGGSYDHCWSALTTSNVTAFAQALVNFCNIYGLDGVDFDIEEFKSKDDRTSQQLLSGRFIKEFKALAPNLSSSLCTNAGFGPYFPWPGVVQNIFDGASSIDPVTGIKTMAVDRLYVMSYYDPIENEKGWLLGWYEWLKTTYNFQAYQLSVGIDDKDAHAYDIQDMAAFAAQHGFSTGYWEFDPAREADSNASTEAILNAYQANAPQ